MSAAPHQRRVLLLGGGGGLLGRAVLETLAPSWAIRSVHRAPIAREAELGVEFLAHDLEKPIDGSTMLDGVDAVVNLAWYRWGSERRFRALGDALVRLAEQARSRGVPFVQVSVPPGPPDLERTLPYFVHKRRLDAAVQEAVSGYAILRPTLMFGPGDVLLGVMLRSIRSFPVFPMFGDGEYRISPIAAADVSRVVGCALEAPSNATQDLGGPHAYRYRDVTDRMYRLLGRTPRYWRLGPRGAVRLARAMEMLGSTRLYAYEVRWLLTDTLALPPAEGVPAGLTAVEPYLRDAAQRLTHGPVPDLGPIPTATSPRSRG
jgi:uncharacterized protein YbjT (DUF2867 family)